MNAQSACFEAGCRRRFSPRLVVLTGESSARLPGDEDDFPVGAFQRAAKEGQVGRGVSKSKANKPSSSRETCLPSLCINKSGIVLSFQRFEVATKKLKAKSKRSINQAGLSSVEELATALGGVMKATESEDRTWMWGIYRDFRRAFRLASNRGFVAFL